MLPRRSVAFDTETFPGGSVSFGEATRSLPAAAHQAARLSSRPLARQAMLAFNCLAF
jgi:hypothetical protein